MSESGGLSHEELLSKLLTKVDGIDEKIDAHNLYVEKELGRRPTRAELYTFLTMMTGAFGVTLALAVL